jgi:hypothetical protein
MHNNSLTGPLDVAKWASMPALRSLDLSYNPIQVSTVGALGLLPEHLGHTLYTSSCAIVLIKVLPHVRICCLLNGGPLALHAAGYAGGPHLHPAAACWAWEVPGAA